jgi:hypothetical protein
LSDSRDGELERLQKEPEREEEGEEQGQKNSEKNMKTKDKMTKIIQ